MRAGRAHPEARAASRRWHRQCDSNAKGRDAMGKSGLGRRLRRIVRGVFPKRLKKTVNRWRFPAIVLTVFLLGGLVFLTPWGCTPKQTTPDTVVPLADRTIRVRLFQGEDRLTLFANQEPVYFTTRNPVP